MSGDPWVAIDATSPPGLRARGWRRKGERFVSGGGVKA
jgi:hypothetical protein